MSKKKSQNNKNYETNPLEEVIELEEKTISSSDEVIPEDVIEKKVIEINQEKTSKDNNTHIEKKVTKKKADKKNKERHYPHGRGKVLFILAPRQIIVDCEGRNYTLCGSYEDVHVGDEIDF